MFRTLLLSILVCITLTGTFAQSIWTNPITDGAPNTFNPFTSGQTVEANLTVSGIGRGSGISGNAGSNRYNATGWSTTALDANDYFYFTLTPAAGFVLNLISFVYTGQASGTGPISFAFRSSLSNYATNIGSVAGSSGNVNLTAAAYQGLTGAITFRFYGWGGTSAAGTYSINDFIFSGTVTPAPPLGLNLLAFTGKKTANGIELNWISSDEENFSHFEIERSGDGKSFQYLSEVKSLRDYSLQKSYSMIDKNPYSGRNYYRLKQVDNDASFTYSKIISIKNEDGISITFNSAQNVINFTGVSDSEYCLIYSQSGQLIKRHLIENNTQMDVSLLPVGIYFAVIENDGERITAKFIKSN